MLFRYKIIQRLEEKYSVLDNRCNSRLILSLSEFKI